MTGRDGKGRFAPGHRLSANLKRATGQKVGRPKSIAGEVRSALELAEKAMPTIIESMIRRATGEESCDARTRQAAAEYLCDRIYGKANQPISNAGRTPLQSFTFVLPDGSQKTAKELLSGDSDSN